MSTALPAEPDDARVPADAGVRTAGERAESTPVERRPLRALFFDIDDTLYSTTEFAEIARQSAVDGMLRAGLKMHRDDALRELNEVILEFSSNYSAHFDKLLARIPAHYYEGVNRAIIIAAGIVGYHETKQRYLAAHEDVIDVLKRLHANTELTLGVITTGLSIKQAEKLWRIGVCPCLDPQAIFISDQIGISKPNPKLFQRACATVGVPAHETMYVGDNWLHDIDPPNAIGMITAHSRRGGRHSECVGATCPDYVVHNFWDLLDVIERDFVVAAKPNAPQPLASSAPPPSMKTHTRPATVVAPARDVARKDDAAPSA